MWSRSEESAKREVNYTVEPKVPINNPSKSRIQKKICQILVLGLVVEPVLGVLEPKDSQSLQHGLKGNPQQFSDRSLPEEMSFPKRGVIRVEEIYIQISMVSLVEELKFGRVGDDVAYIRKEQCDIR